MTPIHSLGAGLLPLTLCLLAGVNVVTFAAFWLDKRRAKTSQRRIPERRLLLLALLGGSLAAKIAQRGLRHKTHKHPFGRRLNLVVALHLLLGAFLCAQALQILR